MPLRERGGPARRLSGERLQLLWTAQWRRQEAETRYIISDRRISGILKLTLAASFPENLTPDGVLVKYGDEGATCAA